MRLALLASLVGLSLACSPASSRTNASSAPADPPLETTTPAAPDETPATTAIVRTPERLAALLTEHDRLVAGGADAATLQRARDDIATMAAQRDAHVSRLFWYTDLDAAKAAAKASGKPILSLRLLGRLDEETSCANSRLFRIVLYADEGVSKVLREQYVLHWSSERPVPQMIVDYGDGRVVHRTITGNSAHYVLDAEGRVVDVLPGLYGPAQFRKVLGETLALAKTTASLSDDDAKKAIAKFHRTQTWVLTARWRKLLHLAYGDGWGDQLDQATLPQPYVMKWSHPLYDSLPAAVVNANTMSKGGMEGPDLAALQPEIVAYAAGGEWSVVARGAPLETIGLASAALLRDKHPRDWSTAAATELDDDALQKRLTAFARTLTDEEVRNEYSLHGAIHAHMARGKDVDFEALNAWVYAKIFFTPKDDAWLGLMPTGAVTGLPSDGFTSLPRPAPASLPRPAPET